MANDIYKDQPLPEIKPDPVKQLAKSFAEVKQRIDDLESKKEVNVFAFPDIQKVELTNQPEPDPIVFPEVQKVEITNPEPVVFPDVQKVEITNQPDPVK